MKLYKPGSIYSALILILFAALLDAQQDPHSTDSSRVTASEIADRFESVVQTGTELGPNGVVKLSLADKNKFKSAMETISTPSSEAERIHFIDTVNPGEIRTTIYSSSRHLSTELGLTSLHFDVMPVSYVDHAVSFFGLDDSHDDFPQCLQYTIEVPLSQLGTGISITPSPVDSALVVNASNIPFLVLEHFIFEALGSGQASCTIEKAAVAFFLKKYIGEREITSATVSTRPSGRSNIEIISEWDSPGFHDKYVLNGEIELGPEGDSLGMLALQGEYILVMQSPTLTTYTTGPCSIKVEQKQILHHN